MPSKIDPDAKPLYKELTALHKALKKAIQEQPADYVSRVLNSVFASAVDRYPMMDANQNYHDALIWTSPIGVGFKTQMVIHLNDDSNVTHINIEDRWMYSALLPLGLKIELHDYWKNILIRTVQLFNTPTSNQIPVFNIWPENDVIKQLGWVLDEDNEAAASIESIDERQAEVARHVIQTLQTEPIASKEIWPNLAPWLCAMQTLAPPPEEPTTPSSHSFNVSDWQDWSTHLRNVFLNQRKTTELLLPDEFHTFDVDSDFAKTSSLPVL